jgi:hypothetical protein
VKSINKSATSQPKATVWLPMIQCCGRRGSPSIVLASALDLKGSAKSNPVLPHSTIP